MYVGLKQPRRDGERCVTPVRAAAKETTEKKKRKEKERMRPRLLTVEGLGVNCTSPLVTACTKTRNTGTPEHPNTPEHPATSRNTGTPRNTGIAEKYRNTE